MVKRLLQRLQPLFVALALLFLLVLLRSQWDELRAHNWQLNLGWLAGSALFLALAWLVEVYLWLRLVRLLRGQLAYPAALRMWFLSAIVRYIPGNIWQPLSLVYLNQRQGVAPEVTITSIALYQMVILLAAAPIAALYFGLTGNWGLMTATLGALAPWLITLALIPVCAVLARPGWLLAALNWVLRRLKRPVLAAQLTRGDLFGVMVLAVVDWLLWGVSFAALAYAVDAQSAAAAWTLAPHLIATYAIAYAIGFLSLITPSGLGVREGAFYLLLAPLLGGGAITVVALAMRVWTTLGELVAAGLATFLPGGQPAADPAQRAM